MTTTDQLREVSSQYQQHTDRTQDPQCSLITSTVVLKLIDHFATNEPDKNVKERRSYLVSQTSVSLQDRQVIELKMNVRFLLL